MAACTVFSNGADSTALDLTVSAGFDIYMDYSVDAIVVGNLASGRQDIIVSASFVVELMVPIDDAFLTNESTVGRMANL